MYTGSSVVSSNFIGAPLRGFEESIFFLRVCQVLFLLGLTFGYLVESFSAGA